MGREDTDPSRAGRSRFGAVLARSGAGVAGTLGAMADPSTPARRLRVAVTGASGLVGSALTPALAARGHEVVALSRSPKTEAASAGVRWVAYDALEPRSVAAAIEDADAVVHLAGYPLFDKRWNDERMALIRSSRVDGTRALVDAIGSLAKKPQVLVSASAIGWYGPLDPDRTVDERDGPGADFLAEVCMAWEAEANRAAPLGVRVVTPRFGIILARGGGALAKMLTPFKLGVGGPIGSGRQVMSWVHIEDVVGVIVAAIEDPRWSGPVNVTAPRPVRSREFAKALGRALHRPAFLRMPRPMLRLVVGRAADVVATGQRVLPRVAEQNGYGFRYTNVDDALAAVLR